MRWTSKDAGYWFSSDNTIIEMYKKRFQAFFLYMTEKGEKLKEVDVAQPKAEDLQTAFDGADDFIKYGDMVEGDAAVLTYLIGCTKEKKLNYEEFDKYVRDKEIDEKYIADAKKIEIYEKCLKKLSSLQEKAERDANAEIHKGGSIKFLKRDTEVLSSTLGEKETNAALNATRKYANWKNVSGSGVIEDITSSKEGASFWGDGKYNGSIKAAVKDVKDRAYETVMGSKTNILTAPLKIFFFGLHELLNPNSVLRQTCIPWMKKEVKKIRDNKKLKDEYKKLGVDLDKMGAEEETPNVEVETEAQTFTKPVNILQRELARGYDFEKDLAEVQVKKEEKTVKEAEEPQQPNQEQDLDNQAQAGDDENAEKEQENKTKEVKAEMKEIQEKIANVILRYNCLIYIMMRAFAGTFGNNKAFEGFSFHPFTIAKKAEEKKEEKPEEKKPEENQNENSSAFDKLSDADKKLLNARFKVQNQEQLSNLLKKNAPLAKASLKSQMSPEGMKALGLAEAVITLKDWADSYLMEAENDQPAQGNNPDTSANAAGEAPAQEQPAQEAVETYLMKLTKGADQWIKHDRMMQILIMRNPDLKQEVIQDARYSTFFVYVNLLEKFLTEYQQYIQAVESNPNFENFRNSTIKMSQIKDLKLQQTTLTLQQGIRYLFQNVVKDKGLRSQLMRSMVPVWMFRKITNIQQFLTIRNMDFTNLKKFITQVLPRLSGVQRDQQVTAEIKSDAIEKLFGEKGMPFAYHKVDDINQKPAETKKEEEQKKEETPAAPKAEGANK